MLIDRHISKEPNAKVLVLFGGSPLRRDEIIRHLSVIPSLTILGALSEEEGLGLLQELPKVDIVLIGGRYDMDQRRRIKNFIQTNFPLIEVTEPGLDYPYNERLIVSSVRKIVDDVK